MMDFPEVFNIAGYFLDSNIEAGRTDKIALRWWDGKATYGEVYEDANRFAHALQGLGLRWEERVLLCLPDLYAFAPAWFGILKAGGVFAMVNPHLPAEDYGHYLAYTRARVVVVDGASLGSILPHLPAARHLSAVVVVGGPEDLPADPRIHRWEELLAAASDAPLTEPTSPDDVAGWLFTSGSTGKPKAAVHRHRDYAFATEAYAKGILGLSEDDVTLSVPKLFFGYATGTNLMFPFAVGGTAVIFPGRSTPDALFDHIERFRPSVLTTVPTMIGLMERHPRAAGADLSCLRRVLSAGEALPGELYERWVGRFGGEILDGIGSAEMFHIYISNRPGEVRVGTLGRIVPGYEARLLGEDGQEVPVGEVGRLHIRGGSTAIMYWGDRAKSIETFRGDECITADYFRQDADGWFTYEGRATDLLKVGGIFVSPLEVENCLLAHPSVAEVAIVGVPDEDGLVKPVAYVVPAAGILGDEALGQDLRAFARERLAYYKAPRRVCFLVALPKNDRGKVDRRALREGA